jgi:phospholipid transport system substrate-binding protein
MKNFLGKKLIAKHRETLRHKQAFALFFVFLLLGILPHSAQAEDFSKGAKAFINSVTEEAISTLTVKNITKEERARIFRIFMKKHFSIFGMSKFVVGRHLRNATEVEKTEYFKLFEDLMVASYSERFAKYSGEKLLMKNAVMRGKKDVIVNTVMVKVGSEAKPLKVDWRVRNNGGSFTIVDVMVEGISMIMTQKAEFSSFLRSSGGEFKELIAEIKKRIKEFTKKNQSAVK